MQSKEESSKYHPRLQQCLFPQQSSFRFTVRNTANVQHSFSLCSICVFGMDSLVDEVTVDTRNFLLDRIRLFSYISATEHISISDRNCSTNSLVEDFVVKPGLIAASILNKRATTCTQICTWPAPCLFRQWLHQCRAW
jgi:hypothetical protein